MLVSDGIFCVFAVIMHKLKLSGRYHIWGFLSECSEKWGIITILANDKALYKQQDPLAVKVKTWYHDEKERIK